LPLDDLRKSIQLAARQSGMVFNPFNPLTTACTTDVITNHFKKSKPVGPQDDDLYDFEPSPINSQASIKSNPKKRKHDEISKPEEGSNYDEFNIENPQKAQGFREPV